MDVTTTETRRVRAADVAPGMTVIVDGAAHVVGYVDHVRRGRELDRRGREIGWYTGPETADFITRDADDLVDVAAA